MFRPPHPFYMVRHGETDWNVEGRFQGRTDIPLNDLGRAQATGNGERLRALIGHEADRWRFVCSPLGRTRETMERLRDAMGLPVADYAIDDTLIEVTFGDWEHHTLDEIKRNFPDMVEERERDKWTFVPPNGESYADAAQRVRPLLEQLASPTVIVTHGGILRATRHLLEGVDGHEAATTPVPQDRIYFHDGEKGRWLD